jgi:hypothetical protein
MNQKKKQTFIQMQNEQLLELHRLELQYDELRDGILKQYLELADKYETVVNDFGELVNDYKELRDDYIELREQYANIGKRKRKKATI